MTESKVKCGTISGHATHRQRGETPCDDCRKAHNAYHRERRAERRRQMAEEDRIWGEVG